MISRADKWREVFFAVVWGDFFSDFGVCFTDFGVCFTDLRCFFTDLGSYCLVLR